MSIEAMKLALAALAAGTDRDLIGNARIALRTAIQQVDAQQTDNTSCKSVQKRLAAQQPATPSLQAVCRYISDVLGSEAPSGEKHIARTIMHLLPLEQALSGQQPATGEPVGWRNVIPGGRKTDEWESTRIADYNLGWNAYRKAAKTALEHLETSTQPLPSAWMYTLEYGGTIADTKVSLRQLNYPFGVCGADYLRENSDGISNVRQTPLYTRPAPSVPGDVVRDAERYRWLRDNWFTMGASYPEDTVEFHLGNARWSEQPESNLDAAIDAAMLAAKGKP